VGIMPTQAQYPAPVPPIHESEDAGKSPLYALSSAGHDTSFDATAGDDVRKIPLLHSYTVFNVAQCDGIERAEDTLLERCGAYRCGRRLHHRDRRGRAAWRFERILFTVT
jgi:hypothetical protein